MLTHCRAARRPTRPIHREAPTISVRPALVCHRVRPSAAAADVHYKLSDYSQFSRVGSSGSSSGGGGGGNGATCDKKRPVLPYMRPN